MKNILFLSLITLSFILLNCKKNDNATAISKLTAMGGIQDSGIVVSFVYAEDKISHSNYEIFGSVNSEPFANFEYSGNNDIKVSSLYSDLNIEFFLNDSKLPVRMTRHETGTDGTEYNSKADFFYKPGTNVLDSVNGYYLNTTTSYIHFTFEYNGANISKAIRRQGPAMDIFSYVYDTQSNLFRSSDSLLYIYSNLFDQLTPLSSYYDYTFYSMIFFFPKVFSTSMLSAFSYTSGNTVVSGKLNYTLSDDNKVLKEWYGGYGREYIYK
ncbi:MAG TPA: hypothetical protein VGP55_15015 [Chitinophagaceae bacterium]|nr:hypothetical protein [Chitinophagaceae bacterium]